MQPRRRFRHRLGDWLLWMLIVAGLLTAQRHHRMWCPFDRGALFLDEKGIITTGDLLHTRFWTGSSLQADLSIKVANRKPSRVQPDARLLASEPGQLLNSPDGPHADNEIVAHIPRINEVIGLAGNRRAEISVSTAVGRISIFTGGQSVELVPRIDRVSLRIETRDVVWTNPSYTQLGQGTSVVREIGKVVATDESGCCEEYAIVVTVRRAADYADAARNSR